MVADWDLRAELCWLRDAYSPDYRQGSRGASVLHQGGKSHGTRFATRLRRFGWLLRAPLRTLAATKWETASGRFQTFLPARWRWRRVGKQGRWQRGRILEDWDKVLLETTSAPKSEWPMTRFKTKGWKVLWGSPCPSIAPVGWPRKGWPSFREAQRRER